MKRVLMNAVTPDPILHCHTKQAPQKNGKRQECNSQVTTALATAHSRRRKTPLVTWSVSTENSGVWGGY